ncbi:helix-turn-helix domain-containing protein [Streptococcus caprae]|uniref:Helix-turn-helix domain-containing protein n=1 Tax=Streptococcus caprae TaxID=1640501 RepID=A0ABV8CVU6_9STRE
MIEKSLGDLFREYRVAKGLQISDVESQTGIATQYLLAIELDQLKLLPKDKTETYLFSYADAIDLPSEIIYEKSGLVSPELYENEDQVNHQNTTDVSETSTSQTNTSEVFESQQLFYGTLEEVSEESELQTQNTAAQDSEVVTVPLFEPVEELDISEPVIPLTHSSGTIFDSGQTSESMEIPPLEFEEPVLSFSEEPVVFENQSESQPLYETPIVEDVTGQSSEEADLTQETVNFNVPKETATSQLSRRGKEQHTTKPKKKSYFGLGLLGLVALAVLGFVGYTFYQQFMGVNKQATNTEVTTTTQSDDSANTQTTVSDATISKATIRTEGGGEYLTAYVNQTTTPVEVKFELTNTAGESWVSLTDDYVGEVGSLLNATTPTYTTKLTEGATQGVLTLGITPDIKVTINGQELDTSALTTTGISYVTLVVE